MFLEWDALTDALSYLVQWRAAGEGYDTANREERVTDPNHVIPRLTPGTAYTLRVAGVVQNTAGAWSDEVTTSTTTVTIAGGQTVPEGEPSVETRTGSTLGYTLTFSAPVTKPVTVYYAYVKAGTTAISGQDFVYHVNSEVVHSGPLFDRLNSDELGQIGKWEIPAAAGSPVSTAILPVTVYGDHRLEPDETVQIRLLGVENAALGSTLTATNTIRNDDELPEIIVGESRSVYEGNTIEVDVWLSAASETTVTVQYHDLLTGTAVPGGSGTGDYPLNRLGTEASPNTLTFDPPGAVPQTVAIWAKNDTEIEGDETIDLRFHSAMNATLRGADGSGNLDVTATILDEDLRPIVTITSGPAVAAGADAEFTLIAQPAPTTDLTVHLEIDATAGYVAPANLGGKTAIIPANQPTATYSVATIDGDATSTSGGVRVTLQPDSAAATPATASYTRGAANEATVTVGDNALPAVIVSEAVLTVGENGGQAVYNVKLNTPPPFGNLTVEYSISAGNFITVSPLFLNFTSDNWTTGRNVTVTGLDNNAHNPGGSFATITHSVQGTNNGFYQDISINSVFVIVTDDDAPDATVPDAPAAPNVTSVQRDNLYVTWAAPSNGGRPAITHYKVRYRVNGVGSFTEPDLNLPTSPLNVNLNMLMFDTEYEVQMQAVNADGASPWSVSGTGTTGAAPTVTLTLTPADINESGTGNVSTVTVAMNVQLTQDVTVDVSATAVSPAVAGDFTLSGNTTLTITKGQTISAGAVTITAVDNSVDAVNKTVTVSGTGTPAGLTVTPATLTITDDDAPAVIPVITIAAGTSPVTEGTAATFTVTADPVPTANLDVSLIIDQSGDYVAAGDLGIGKTVTILANAASATYEVDTIADSVDELNGSVTASLAARPLYSVGNPSMATVNVNDDDAGPTLTIAGPTLADAFLEGASGTTEMMEFDVTSTAASLYPVGCWTQQNAGTVLAADYVHRNTHDAPTSHLDLSDPSQLSRTFAVTVNGDDIDDGDKRVAVRCIFVGLGGSYNSLTTTGGITDDDARGITFDPSPVTVVEDAGTAYYTVVLDSQPTADVTVTLGVTEGEGTGAVTLASSAPLTFTTGNWATVKTVTLTIGDDDIDNPNDRRTATISHTTAGGDYGDNNVAASLAVTVTDDDEANTAPTFDDGENAVRSVAENSGANVNVGAAVSATDAENDALTYTLTGADAASFEIDGANGQLKTKSGVSYDFETKDTYSVMMTVTATGGSDSINVTINLTDANDAPVFTDGNTTTREVPENSGANVNVGLPLTATDQDRPADTLSYTLSGTDAASFRIVQTTGQLQTVSGVVYDYEAKSSYEVTVTVNDGGATNNSATITVTITLTDVVEAGNTAPTFTDGANTTRAIGNENVGAATEATARNVGAAVAATDLDGHTLTYSLSGADAGAFEIDAASGQLSTKVGETYDYEAKASYEVMLTVDDGNGGTDSITVAITLTDVNEPPLAPAQPMFGPPTANSLEVIWSAPDNAARPAITGYDLRYKLSTVTSWTDGPQNVAVDTLSAEIGSLTSGAQYDVQARASNADGDGPWSASGAGSTSPAQATASGVTVYAFNLPSGNALAAAPLADGHASRTPPADKALETGPVDVSLSHALSGGQQVTLCMPGTGELARHDGAQWNVLTGQSTRTIEGSAAACATVTEFSPFAVLTDGLGQVTGLNVTPAPNALDLSWTAVTDATGYKVQWKSGVEDYDSATPEAAVTGTTHTIPNLTPGTQYTVRVAATKSGEEDGAWSDEMTGTPTDAGICGRTQQVQDALVAAISEVSDCANVTDTHLAGISGALDLHDQSIASLQAGDFAGLTSLTTLRLNSNQLSTLPTNAFSGLTTLTTLYLNSNQLSTLPAAISGLTSLTQLYLNDNRLSTLPTNAFSGLTSLTTLSLSANELSTLPTNAFSGLTSLTTLSLNGNELSTLPANAFSGLTLLTTLYLKSNQFSTLPAAISGLTSLTILDLSDNQFSTLPTNAFSGLTSLTQLSLHFNQLSTLPAFGGLTLLTQLRLDGNQLSTLPANAFSGLTSLTTLRLDGNTVNPLPLTVSLELAGDGQFKAAAPSGAPFAIVVPVTVANGSLDGGATTLTIPAGAVESSAVTVTGTGAASDAVTADIGILPGLPSVNHRGYFLEKAASLPLEVIPGVGSLGRVTIAVGAGPVTEGTSTEFTITVDPAPASPLRVNLTIADRPGASGLAVRRETVTIPATQASVTHMVATTNDNVKRPDGVLRVTVMTGKGYAVGTPRAAVVRVTDDDDPAKPTVFIRAVYPEPDAQTLAILVPPKVVEGSPAQFIVGAYPPQETALTVHLSIVVTGSYVATSPSQTGRQSVVIPAGGSTTTHEVTTEDDETMEDYGSITATLQVSAGNYTVGPADTATVIIADDDAPAGTPVISIKAPP